MALRSATDRGVGVREELRAFVRGVAMLVASGPLHVAVIVVLDPLRGLAAPLAAFQLGRIVDAIPEVVAGAPDAGQDLWTALVLLAVAVAASRLIEPVSSVVSYAHGERFQRRISVATARAATRLPGLAHFEDPKTRDRVHVASWAVATPQRLLPSITQALAQVATVVGFAAVAAQYGWWVPVLILLAALPEAVAEIFFVQSAYMARFSGSEPARRSLYFGGLGYSLPGAKELRVFGLDDFVLRRRDMHWLRSLQEYWRVRGRTIVYAALLHLLGLGAAGLAYVLLLRDAVAGTVELGVFVATSAAIYSLASGLPQLLTTLAFLRRDAFFLPDAFRVIDMPATDPRMNLTTSVSVPSGTSTGIRFEGVRFAYPGTDRVILDGLDLDIPAGQSIAIVGPNGEGKTTLIKLLCRFYDPDSGRILLDGVDLRDWDLAALRARLAVIFQDFVRYWLPARDNIGFGSPPRADDEELVRDAASRVGVLDRLEQLPNGLDTPLSRVFDGVELSGGEWQRVALARAVMAQLGGADTLVLDEPTASLDVRLEHDLYERFLDIRRGCTTILISHRFSTVRMADRIVLLAAGRVAEDGTHAELVELGGRYAELYGLQARHFRETGALE